MLGTPKMTKSQSIFSKKENSDPHFAAMEGLKTKLKNFIYNNNQVVWKLKSEIQLLKRENEYLRNKSQ